MNDISIIFNIILTIALIILSTMYIISITKQSRIAMPDNYRKMMVYNNYKVITLCGSTRFKKEFEEVQKELSLRGHIVLSVGCFGHSGDNEVWENKNKEVLDDIHKRKIDLSHAIMVINKDNYIGESTKSEIEYAKDTGKTVLYWYD